MSATISVREPLKIPSSSFPRKREPSKNKELDARFRGHDRLLEVPIRMSLPAFLATVILVLAVIEPAEAGPPSYPLVCRGGGGMTMHLSSGITTDTEKVVTKAIIYFEPSAAAASSAPPRAGQCAWLDRGFGAGEPRALSMIFWDVGMEIGLRANGTWGDVVPASRNAQRASQLRDLVQAFRTGEAFQMHVRLDARNGWLEITRFGP